MVYKPLDVLVTRTGYFSNKVRFLSYKIELCDQKASDI